MKRSTSRVLLPLILAAPLAGQVTSRVSVATSGAQASLGAGVSGFEAMSADGRYVVLVSSSSNLVPADTNGYADVFVRDRLTGTTERVSVDSGGVEGNSVSTLPAISADGRYVAFFSEATNLVPGDTNAAGDVFVRDRETGTTERVSLDSDGIQGNAPSLHPSISSDGRYVAFGSEASNLVAGDTNLSMDVFVRDRLTGTTERVSVSTAGAEGFDASAAPSISADGRFVVFGSVAPNLVAGDSNGFGDILVRDRQSGTTERASVDSSGVQADGASLFPSISDDGRYVAFGSDAANLVAGDTNGTSDVFVRDLVDGNTERASVDSIGSQANGPSYWGAISDDGRYVAFFSYATNLAAADTNGDSDVFVRDRQVGKTVHVSLSSGGIQGNGGSDYGSVSGAGRYVLFNSEAANLVPGDTNGLGDAFVRDLEGAAEFTSLCDPGAGGVQACPCSNPPSGSGRGCDNSAATGGAALSAAGGAYLSSDSLVFMTSGEKPTATSILLQGTTHVAGGVVYGQGIRCLGGTLKRLFTKAASGGSITAPNLPGGDPTVSARSSALGSPISAGQSRWYLVFYRDPIVIGGCPVTSTFNATQTGRVDWSN